MSKILKRPMFRDGGRANSKGTGIMTGVEDREEYQYGGDVNFYPRTTVPTIQDVLERGYGSLGAKVVGEKVKESAAEEVARAQDLYNKLGFVPNIESLPTLPYDPTDKPFQGQPSFRSMQEPTIYTPPTTEDVQEGLETETIVTDMTARQAEDASMKALEQLEKDKDLDKIDLDDFEAEITEKSKLYEKLLAGPDAKKQSIFRALTAAAPGLLAEDYGTAIKAAGEQLGDVSDIRRKARLLAIQEKIEKDKALELAKLKTKDVSTSQIKNYEYQIGLGKSPEEAAKIAFGTGDNVQARESEEDIRYTERKLIKTEGSGFEKANITGYEQAAVESTVYGIPTTPYVSAEPGATPEKAPSNAYFKAIGDIYYDPITRKFEVLVEEEGTTKIKRVKSRDEAFKLAGR